MNSKGVFSKKNYMINVFVCVCMYVCMFMYVCVCMYMYIYMCVCGGGEDLIIKQVRIEYCGLVVETHFSHLTFPFRMSSFPLLSNELSK
jgi:hypothetical protein